MSNLILERPPGVKELICDLSNVSTPVTVIPHNRPSNYTGNPHSDDGLYRVHYVHYYPLSWEEIEFIKVRPRFAPSQWETALLCNDVSHWLGATITMTSHERHLTVCLTAYMDRLQRNIKVCVTGSLWGEFTGNRWIPLTKGQSRIKCFHLMTSSCKQWGWDKMAKL